MKKILSAVVAILVAAPLAAKAEFPDKPITIQAPYAPGGNIDVTARIVADKLKDVLGVSVVVDNKAGASGMIGSAAVARSAPDGYNLLVSANSMVDVPAIYGNAPYDWKTAFQPISTIQSVPAVVVVPANSPIRTFADFIKAGRETPGKVTIGDSGVGTTNHIVIELLSDATRAKFTIAHYKGSGAAAIDVIGGQVMAQVDQALNSAIGHIRGGKLRALAVSSDARVAELPDVPTIKESGVAELKDFTYSTITGLFGPANLPPAVLAKLNEAMVKVLTDPATVKRFADLSATAKPSTPAELAAILDHEDKTVVPLIKKLGMKPEVIAARRLETAGLLAVLALAAALRLWRIEANGFGTEYYAAGVRSMLQGARLFFYNAFDPAGVLSLDKPPVAFWIQTAFARLLGFDGWTIHLPQAVAGVASVALLHRLVRGPFGPAAAAIAALLLATTPIAVAIDRSNNTDSWLIFFPLLLSATAALRGRGLSLVIAMALLGIAFNVKMLAALVCGPALLAGWWLAAPADRPFTPMQRLGWMTAAAAVLVAASLSWAIAFDLTPAASRPFAGSSQKNSMLDLIVVHNGLERFVRNRPETPAPPAQNADTTRIQRFDAVPVGPLRLATPRLSGQFAWMLVPAVLGFALAAGFRRRRDATQASLALWGFWALAYGVVFSTAGGIFHAYYLSALGPPLAALAAIGCVQLWRRGPLWLAAGLFIAALWQAAITASQLGWTSPWSLAPGVAVLAAVAVLWRGKRPASLIGGAALLVLPSAWALSAIYAPGNLTLPSASLARWLGIDDGRGPLLSREVPRPSEDPKLLAFLTANRGAARFVVAAPITYLAAPVIVRTGQPALAVGGYLGDDPILSVEAFAAMAARGEVRYVLLFGGRTRTNDFIRWVRANGKPVDPALWRTAPAEPGRRPILLYELAARADAT